MEKKAPNRYSPDKNHRIYGIKNWLKNNHIQDKALKKLLIHGYLEKRKFSPKGRNKVLSLANESVVSFIHNRFPDFASFCTIKVKELANTTQPPQR